MLRYAYLMLCHSLLLCADTFHSRVGSYLEPSLSFVFCTGPPLPMKENVLLTDFEVSLMRLHAMCPYIAPALVQLGKRRARRSGDGEVGGYDEISCE